MSNVGVNFIDLQAEDLYHHVDPRGVIHQLFDITVNNCNVNAIAMNKTVQLDLNGNASIIVSDINNGSTASCGIDTITLDKMNFDCNNVGSNTVILTVTDVNGNVSTTTATVTVLDVLPINAVDDEILLNSCSAITFSAADLLGNDIDPYGRILKVDFVEQPSSGTIVDNGNNTFTYTPGLSTNHIATATYTVKPNDGTTVFTGNGHFYEFVSAPGISWTAAKAAAEASTYQGQQGYLVTITSAAENSFAFSKINAQGWIGASDAAVEGEWRWTGGPENGLQFWSGYSNGSAVNGLYNAWGGGEPNNAGNEDYAHFLSNGLWNDLPLSPGGIQGYVVEYGGLVGDCNVQTTATASIEFKLEDNILPIIVCPSNIDAGFTTDVSGISVTYSTPVGTDNCSATTTLVAGLASGATFPIGVTTVTYRVTDGANNTVDCSFTVTVALNNNPIATDDSYPIDEDTTVILTPLTQGIVDSDPDGDLVTITSINNQALLGGTQIIPVNNGIVNIDAGNVITFTPNSNFNGSVMFPYAISDGKGGVHDAIETIIINPMIDLPIAIDDSYTINEDTSISLTPLTTGIADSHPDGTPFKITNVNGDNVYYGVTEPVDVLNGTLVYGAAGELTFTPDANFYGTVTFPYTITDDNGGIASAIITIIVNSVNDVPIATDNDYEIYENSQVILSPLTGDSDPEGDTLTITSINGVALLGGVQTIPVTNGVVEIDVNDVITFIPTAGYGGLVILPYEISDGNTGTATANQNITVNKYSSIGNTVWYDTDGDGIVDAGEPGLEGATVTLDPGTQGNTGDDVITTTDANGNYLFTNLIEGDYVISVSVGSVTSGIPVGFTTIDLVQIFDADGLGSPSKSYLTLGAGENNIDQNFGWVIPSGTVSGGNAGGVESESLGDAISKIYVGRKKNSMPTEFVKSDANLYNKTKMKAAQPYQGKGQTMLDMFPTQLVAGNVANVTSPTDILDYTVADEVLSVDFSVNGETKGVVLGIKTSDKIYNHTKASCDRLRGAEILNIQKVQLEGYNFLMQGIKQRNGIVEYAISFATAKNNNDTNYTIQTNWYVNNYTKFNDVYNFQVWSTKPADTQKMVTDILENLQSYIPVNQTEIQKVPETYASKIFREKGELVVNLRSTKVGNTADISMIELYSETANNIKHRYNTLDTEIQQSLRLDIADGYEYEGLIEVEKEVEDAFYHADGNWGLDYDKNYTEILNYFVWNDFDRTYEDDEYSINRNVEIKATSEYDYLTVYKSLLPGTISADYSEYKYLSFTAKGSGLMELGLIKSSVENWKEQYRLMVDLSAEEQTYYVPFEYFTSTGTTAKITADDLTTIAFTFLPVEANTKELDLFISDVKFTKTAVEEQTVAKIEKFENNFMAYPNPSKGNVNVLLYSKVDTNAIVSLYDVTGKEIYNNTIQLTTGKNEIDFNVKVKPGMLFLKVNSNQVNYGTSKIIFR